MATQQQSGSVFTNARLMLAGAILGLIGAILAFVWVKNEVRKRAGGDMVTTYVLNKDLKQGTTLAQTYVDPVEVPRSYFDQAKRLVTNETLGLTIGRTAMRDLDQGEPLVLTEFQTRTDVGNLLDPSPGGRYRRIVVDRGSLPANIGPGSVIDVLGSFNFAKDRGGKEDKVPALRVLERVQVIATGKEGGITLDLGEFASELITALDSYKEHSYIVEGLARNTLKSNIKEQVPAETVDLVRQKFKDLGVQMPLQN